MSFAFLYYAEVYRLPSFLFQLQVAAEHRALLLSCNLKVKDMVQSIYP